MRNGDYVPSRLDAQQDAGKVNKSQANTLSNLFLFKLASLICNDRTNSNPESTVGILSMAGQGYQ
jgi:hypothetical protein